MTLRRKDFSVAMATTEQIETIWKERWFGLVVSLKKVYHPDEVEGITLVDGYGEVAGLVTFHVDGPAAQILTLDTILTGRGLGRRLLEVVEKRLHARGVGRVWAVITNDNLRAAGLYISRGYRLVRVHLDALKRVRELKPKLPDTGYEGIPIRDLWELENISSGTRP